MRGRGNGRFFRGGPFLRRNLILRMSSKKVRKTTNLLTIKARINHLATKLKLGRNSLLNFIRKIVLLKLSPLFQHPKSTTNLETKLPLHAQSIIKSKMCRKMKRRTHLNQPLSEKRGKMVHHVIQGVQIILVGEIEGPTNPSKVERTMLKLWNMIPKM